MMMLFAKATLAILMAFAICLAARRSRASFRHAVYASLFAALLVLPFTPRLMSEVQATVPAARNVMVNVTAPTVMAAAVEPSADLAPQPDPASWPSLRDVYITGVILMLASLAAGIWRLRRWAQDGEVWLDGTRKATEVACESGIRRAVLVVVSHDVATPLTFGFHRQTIVLPDAARSWDEGLLRRAMRHELEHVRRNDWLLQILARVTVAVYWPHVLVWVAWRRFCVEAERTCDDAVVNAFEPATYASELVAMARLLTHRVRVPALAMASPTRLSERVHAILDPGQVRGPHGRITSILTMAAVAAVLVLAGSVRLVAAPQPVATFAESGDRDRDIDEVVIHAAEKGSIPRLRQLLDNGTFKINHAFEGDGTAMMIAAKYGHIDAVRFLLDRGADPNVASRGDGNALIIAAATGELEIARMLLDRGARVDDIVPGDETALINAADSGHGAMVRLLIDRGANVNLGVRVERMDGNRTVTELRTPLRMARRGGDSGIIKMLTDAGARE